MADVRGAERLPDKWDDQKASGMSEPERLLYRSNLLGSDLRVTNFGGGNTSAKVTQKDPLTGKDTTVLWVKGSGGDLGSMGKDGFSTLYLDKLESLKGLYRGLEHEDEMVGYLPHCTFDLNPRAASIDTPLHAFIPKAHVDHMHPDAVIAIAASRDSERLTREVFGGEIGWLPWQRPGFDLGLKLEAMAQGPAGAEGHRPRRPRPPHLGRHRQGVLPADAAHHPEGRRTTSRRRGSRSRSGSRSRRRSATPRRPRSWRAARPRPAREALEGRPQGHALHGRPGGDGVRERGRARRSWPRSAPPAPTTSSARRSGRSSSPSTPRRRRPTRWRDVSTRLLRGLPRAIRGLLRALQARRPRRPCAIPYPVIVLVPGVGLLSFAKDKATARIASEFYVNAIDVMRGAESVVRLRADPRAGGLRHRVLAARGGQAPADAEAEEPGGPDRPGDGRRRRDRRGDRAAAAGRGRLRRDHRHRPGGARRGAAPRCRRSTGRTACGPSAAT